MPSNRPETQLQRPLANKSEPRPVEQLVWLPPDLEEFDTPMEVTAYAGRR
jgi:hypothetical protein